MQPKDEQGFVGFEQKILSLYARGMSTRKLQEHSGGIYSAEVSPPLTSEVTEAVMEDVRARRSRSVAPLYPIVYMDALQ